ncbi:glycerophosphodiester phosphodiesterase [Paenibacillus thalictri]|uniref:Glycerophosphodiester phosphodiesterase n=1 Tax=Paenibacillus thalictri TaxID=2527873 RepID=A0A4Q9DIQ4_9BACL|nr:glycerophosphodiester phosphodiesterase family protein [Paenibacillus thalictri]TBL71088.1 glycerophosphodiester phosphodiesterase [Paenibacillus thalictri]
MIKKVVVFAVLFTAGFTAIAPNTAMSPIMASSAIDKYVVTAHRGSSGSAPENTLSAFRKAAETGAGYSELDVQETADGVVMVMHDDNVRRTTGINKNMWDIESGELKKASAGAWYGAAFQDERVPTLEETIAAVKGKTRLNIELKNNGHQQRLAEKTVKLIEDAGFVKDCTITSFDVNLIRQVKAINRAIKTGLIVGEKPRKNPEQLFESGDYDVLSAAYPLIDKAFMQSAAAHHKEVYAWTVNDKARMHQMLDLGVNSVITNYPEQLIEVLKERGARD